MKKLALSDVRGPRVYTPMRDDFRQKVIALKRPRRVEVGDRVMLVFENRATMLFQVEEMLRAEGITEPAKIQDELDVYNGLLPDLHQLSATLFLEFTDQTRIKDELREFVGLDEHVYLTVGDDRIRAEFEPGRQEKDRIAAVQYIRFTLTPAQIAGLTGAAPLGLTVDHPKYQRTVALGDDTRRSLAADLID